MAACLAARARAADWSQGGYADRLSVVQGGTITFHIATANSPFTLQLVNFARPNQVLATIGGLTSAPNDCSGKWESGCGWPVTAQYTVPSNWPSGYYGAKFPTGGGVRWIFFVVRPASPASTSPIAVIATTNTYTAYNQFGGKSVYDTRSTDHQRAHVVSFERPFDDNAGLGRFPIWEQQFVDWMTAESRAFEVITDDDLADPSILGHYKLVVIVGHSEYWTRTMREHLAAFRNAGGHVAIFGGNTMWWQARVDAAARTFTCYKDAALDPETGVHDELVTVNFYDAPVYDPENSVIGLSFRNAGYANIAPNGFDTLPPSQRTPWTVREASSWIFANTGLANGSTFGKATGGLETDGAIYNVDASGALVADGSDGTPRDFAILATIPAEEGYGIAGMSVNAAGGALVNFGTQDWSHGLAGDAVVAQMTRNVLDRLATGAPFPYQPRASSWLTESTFNEPSPNGIALPGWRGTLDEISLSAQCAHEGAFGLKLTGAHWTQLARRFLPTRAALPNAEFELFLNANALTGTADWPIPLVELVHRDGGEETMFGTLELQKFGASTSVRFTAQRAATPWVALDPGWQKVTASWQSPGVITLRVGTKTPVAATNPDAGQSVNEIYLEYVGTDNDAIGSLCVDEIRVKTCAAPVITQQPQSATIVSGSSITLSVTANATSYQWFAGTTPLDGATSSSITVSPATTTTYHARVTNACTSIDSAEATVTVCQPPLITQQPQSATIVSGTSITLSVTANATSYQWFAGAAPIDGATSSSLTVSPNATTTYHVRVTNACTSIDSAEATVTVCQPPVITQQPQSTTIVSGSSITLFVSANATSYQWFAGTTPIGGATSSSITVSPASTTTYHARVTNACTSIDSADATVTVCQPPAITQQPQSATIVSGSSTTLSVTANGTSYQWFAGATPIDGATSSSITVSPNATTTYHARVTNACTSIDSADATVTVTPKGATSLYTMTPCRLFDTRSTGAAAAGETIVIQVAGRCGVPASAKAIAINLTAVVPGADGFLVAFAAGQPRPDISSMNYRAGKTRAASSIVKLDDSGALAVFASGPSAVHFVVDVSAYFQ